MFFKRKSNKNNEYINFVRQAVEELRQGKQSYLSVIYQVLASENIEVLNYASSDIALYMQDLDSNQTIRLDEQFREYSSIEWNVSWEKIDIGLWEKSIKSEEAYLWALRLGTFHPNGYFREKCIFRLAKDKESVKFVLLRLNDWVGPVRKAAEIVVLAWIPKLNAEELVACLPYWEKVKQGMRRDSKLTQELENYITERIQSQLPNVNLKNLGRYDIKARKYLYRILLERSLLTKEEANEVLKREKSGQCQFLLMTLLLKNYEFSVEELDTYLNHKSKVVQRKALEQKYSIIRTYWEGLEKMLLAPSISVREQVRYILQKHTDIDVLAYYKERLETSQRKICILGIGECGSSADADDLLKYLDDSKEGIVKSTLHAISKLLGSKADEIFWKYLQDEREVVQRAAYREIATNNIIYGAKQIYELFIQTESSLLREKLAHQLLRERSWDRLPYVLQLYCYEEESIRKIIRRGVNGRSVYGIVSKEKAEMIRGILYDDKYCIPEHLQKSIEFDLKFVVR